MAKSAFLTRKIPQEGMEILNAGNKRLAIKSWGTENVIPREDLLKEVKGMHGILCTICDNIDKEVLDAAGRKCSVCFRFLVRSFIHLTVFCFLVSCLTSLSFSTCSQQVVPVTCLRKF